MRAVAGEEPLFIFSLIWDESAKTSGSGDYLLLQSDEKREMDV
jgi:hypothetical protein